MKLVKICILIATIFPSLAFADSTAVESCNLSELSNAFPLNGNSERIKPYTSKERSITFKLPDNFDASSEVTITEAERQTRLTEEISKIIQNTKGIRGQGAAQPGFACIHYTQKYERARITVTIKPAAGESSKRTYIAGPLEHWYLSADMPVTKAKQLTYDAKNNAFVEKSVPQSFYLGINYKLGDVYVASDYTDHVYENLSLKLLFKVAAPSESYGLGLGYDFGPAVVFVARIRTVNDASASNAPSSSSLSTVYGISFDIEKGISWLSGK